MISEAPKPPAVLAGEHLFDPFEHAEKGSCPDIVAAEREATAAKTARLKAAREAQEAARIAVEVEATLRAPGWIARRPEISA